MGKKEIITEHIKTTGESLNGFVNRAIDDAMAKGAPAQSSEANGNGETL